MTGTIMNKWKKAWKALLWVARKPVLLNRVLTDEDTWRALVEKKYGLADGLPVIRMEQLSGTGVMPASVPLGPMTFLDGGSLPTDMLLLATLASQVERCAVHGGVKVPHLSPRLRKPVIRCV